MRLDPDALFDVQVKRIHEYKRQLLAALRVIEMYLEIADDGRDPVAPRACIFGGKAAPEYFTAKLVIRLINEVARAVNHDPQDARQAARRVRARLPRLARREDHPRRGPLGADLDRRPGGVRAPAT